MYARASCSCRRPRVPFSTMLLQSVDAVRECALPEACFCESEPELRSPSLCAHVRPGLASLALRPRVYQRIASS